MAAGRTKGRGKAACAAQHRADAAPVPIGSSDERLNEVACILALGILRLRARPNPRKANNPNHLREFGLDFPAEQSVHGLKPDDGREGP